MTNAETAQSLELRPYQRLSIVAFLITAVFPSLLLLVFYLESGSGFWLFAILFLTGFGALNMYFMGPGRPLPTVVRLAPEGIAFTTNAGKELRFNWDDVDIIHDHFKGRRYKHHVEIRFKQSSERLLLYRTSMKVSERDGQTFDNELGDGIAGTIDAWDKPIRLARSIIAQHVPDFKA